MYNYVTVKFLKGPIAMEALYSLGRIQMVDKYIKFENNNNLLFDQ